MRKVLFPILIFIITLHVSGQEFYCNVQVNSQQVEGTDKRVFETLQNAIFEFMNNKKWTNYSFKIEERIECAIVITISRRISSDVFEGTINLVLRRPAYKTSYNSALLNFIDKDFQFRYIEYQPLDYSDNVYTSNLTSVLAFYTYIFLGLDFDSFSLYGGTPYYEKAQAIVNTAQNAGERGWKAYENQRNRYWLVENLLNPAYQKIRIFIYEYHRKGLDMMAEDTQTGRANITKSLDLLQKLYNERPGLFILQVMLDTKRDEIIDIYSEGSPVEKTKAVNILKKVDPANSSRYQEILNK